MPLMSQTKELLRFLHNNSCVRSRIAAPPNATVLYAGNFMRPVWRDLEALKLANPEFTRKKMLPDSFHTAGLILDLKDPRAFRFLASQSGE